MSVHMFECMGVYKCSHVCESMGMNVHMCVSAWVYTSVHMCVSAHAHRSRYLWRLEVNTECLPQSSFTYVMSQGPSEPRVL